MARLSNKLRSVDLGDHTGVAFWCPGCVERHVISVTGPHAWSWDQNVDAPTFVPSIHVSGIQRLTEAEYAKVMAGVTVEKRPLVCHSFIRGGRIEFLSDCTHGLAGQTIPLPDLQSDPSESSSGTSPAAA
jgi:hypothetical protein